MALPIELLYKQTPTVGSPTSLVYGDDADTIVIPVDPVDPRDLLFSQAPAIGLPVALVFGDTGVAAPSTLHEVTLTAALPPPGAAISVVVGTRVELLAKLPDPGAVAHIAPLSFATVSAQLPAPGAVMTVQYLTQTQRPTVNLVSSLVQRAASLEVGVGHNASITLANQIGVAAHFQDGTGSSTTTKTIATTALQIDQLVVTQFQNAQRNQVASVSETFDDGVRVVRPNAETKFQEAVRAQAPYLYQRFQDGIRNRTNVVRTQSQKGVRHSFGYQGFAGPARVLPLYKGVRFQDTRKPPAGVSPPPVIPGLQPCYTPSGEMIFTDPTHGRDLVFYCGIYTPPPVNPELPGQVIVPIRRIYMVLNSATLKRVDGNIYLPTFTMSLSLDVDSWAWGFSASLPADTLANLEPASSGAPVEVEAVINGVAYRALVESISRSREFGKSGITVQGRGKTALLDSPYSPQQSFINLAERTAQQIMGDVLTLNGVPLGWSVDWALADWLVPEGVFSHQGSYISALNQIAASVGAYVQPHATSQSLKVLHRYPTAPWAWGTVTPDFELPVDVTTREGIEWVEKARYNRVFVSGVGQGVLGQVTRAGTAGDLVAPMVTDALITDAVAARQRGRSILSDTGRIANVSLRMPVLPETGIITPGKFVRYVDGASSRVGIVRSVNVDVGMPEVWQTIGVETHVN